MERQAAVIYIDGSFNHITNIIGCAILLSDKTKKKPQRIVFRKQLKSQEKYGSNIAELIAAKTAVKVARSQGIKQIDIFYDWIGIEHFSHKANIKSRHKICSEFSKYAQYIENARETIDIKFVKVKAHSGNEKNLLVDKMARSGGVI
ncbi:MAG: RNase H family protein [Erysipelotrichaceae bacterium]